jgi:putative membrane protein
MKEFKSVIVLCVDRDNDLGRKAGVKGPVIGREKNVKAALKLALADPADTDSNAIFASIKKFDEVKEHFEKIEIVTITGHSKSGFKSDKELNEQLDFLMQKFEIDGFIFVSDGAEDDQIIPILQARAPIISKETIIVKQAQKIESAYYTIKEALKDPFIARIVFGVPGIILLLFFALGSFSFQIISLVFGVYLLLKGFGIEDKIFSVGRAISSSISIQRTSFPFYVASLFIFLFGLLSGYNNFVSSIEVDLIIKIVETVQVTYLFFALTALSFLVGKVIDALHFKKAFYLRKYFLSATGVILLWFILDSSALVFTNKADLNYFLLSVVFSFIVFLVLYKSSEVLDIRNRITPLLIGLPIYDTKGKWLGKVENINKREKLIEYIDVKTKKPVKLVKKHFILKQGKIIVQ